MINAVEQNARLYKDVPLDDQIHKITEENGEVADAVIGIRGSNPRKGVYKTIEDLDKELLDVALTALSAWGKLNLLQHDPVQALITHAEKAVARHHAEVAG